jgi:hypothetical protein
MAGLAGVLRPDMPMPDISADPVKPRWFCKRNDGAPAAF